MRIDRMDACMALDSWTDYRPEPRRPREWVAMTHSLRVERYSPSDLNGRSQWFLAARATVAPLLSAGTLWQTMEYGLVSVVAGLPGVNQAVWTNHAAPSTAVLMSLGDMDALRGMSREGAGVVPSLHDVLAAGPSKRWLGGRVDGERRQMIWVRLDDPEPWTRLIGRYYGRGISIGAFAPPWLRREMECSSTNRSAEE